MRECWNSIGISPYLILPHAALIYNETLVDWAERGISAALADHGARLGALEDAHFDADTSPERAVSAERFQLRHRTVPCSMPATSAVVRMPGALPCWRSWIS